MLMKHLVAYVKQYWFLQKININECKLVQKPVKTSKKSDEISSFSDSTVIIASPNVSY
jgi:hypothetical protein